MFENLNLGLCLLATMARLHVSIDSYNEFMSRMHTSPPNKKATYFYETLGIAYFQLT